MTRHPGVAAKPITRGEFAKLLVDSKRAVSAGLGLHPAGNGLV